jgi:hypothetical protein
VEEPAFPALPHHDVIPTREGGEPGGTCFSRGSDRDMSGQLPLESLPCMSGATEGSGGPGLPGRREPAAGERILSDLALLISAERSCLPDTRCYAEIPELA